MSDERPLRRRLKAGLAQRFPRRTAGGTQYCDCCGQWTPTYKLRSDENSRCTDCDAPIGP